MSRPGQEAPDGEFGAAYWEQRYVGGEGAPGPVPSQALVVETAGLAPGRALDAGCGRGAEALWLARRGWQVTAVDVSPTAVGMARESARAAGPDIAQRIEWVCADLTEWIPDGAPFDLVTSLYVHVPGPADELFGRLASWVAPGGTLLVVGHAHDDGADHHDGRHDRAHGRRHGGPHPHPVAAQVRSEQVTVNLPADQWLIGVAEHRTHTVRRAAGSGAVAGSATLHDTVVRATRRVREPPA